MKYNMKVRLFKFICAACLAVAAVSCAEDKDESSYSIQKRILDAYIKIHYPQGLTTTENGTKIISMEEGTGNYIKKYDGVYLNTTIMDLEGNYISTTNEDVAKQLGTYSKSTHYAPKLNILGVGSVILGLEELLYTMRADGKVEAIIPPWTSNYEYSKKSYANTTNLIYKIEVAKVVSDISDYQNSRLNKYSATYYDAIDTTAAGFYFKTLDAALSNDTIPKSESINVRYVGKLLDGFVFDTNIRDSAKAYGIYDSSKSYDALSITYSDDYSTIKENNSVVEGFAKAVSLMKRYGERAVTFFSSDWGYTSQGSGDNIDAYEPLFFYLYIEPEE